MYLLAFLLVTTGTFGVPVHIEEKPKEEKQEESLPPGAIARIQLEVPKGKKRPRVACSPDGKTLSYTNYKNEKVVIWNLGEKKAVKTIVPPEGKGDVYQKLSPDGKTLLLHDDQVTAFVDLESGKKTQIFANTLKKVCHTNKCRITYLTDAPPLLPGIASRITIN